MRKDWKEKLKEHGITEEEFEKATQLGRSDAKLFAEFIVLNNISPERMMRLCSMMLVHGFAEAGSSEEYICTLFDDMKKLVKRIREKK